jgi:hypothetical protein
LEGEQELPEPLVLTGLDMPMLLTPWIEERRWLLSGILWATVLLRLLPGMSTPSLMILRDCICRFSLWFAL